MKTYSLTVWQSKICYITCVYISQKYKHICNVNICVFHCISIKKDIKACEMLVLSCDYRKAQNLTHKSCHRFHIPFSLEMSCAITRFKSSNKNLLLNIRSTHILVSPVTKNELPTYLFIILHCLLRVFNI